MREPVYERALRPLFYESFADYRNTARLLETDLLLNVFLYPPAWELKVLYHLSNEGYHGDQLLYQSSQMIQFLRIYVRALLSWRSIITFGCCALGNFLFYAISWMPLQLFLAKVIVDILTLAGHPASRIHNDIFVGSAALRIGTECTYIRLVLVGLPFVWIGDSLTTNALRIIFFVGVVFTANVARLYFNTVFSARGMPWKYAHDLVNHLTYGPIVILLILLWLKAMRLRFSKNIGRKS